MVNKITDFGQIVPNANSTFRRSGMTIVFFFSLEKLHFKGISL